MINGYADRWQRFYSDPFSAVHSVIMTAFGWINGECGVMRPGLEWSVATGVAAADGSVSMTPVMGLICLAPLATAIVLHVTR